MNYRNKELDRQMEAAYSESGAFGRRAACVLLAIAFAALFVYRAATTDPLWEIENAAAESGQVK